jgi:hypothetical protein
MASARTLAWIDALIWFLIYGGLFAVVLGIATHGVHTIAGWSLGVLGGIATAAGVLLIGVRSRLREAPPGGAQSSENQRGTP